MMNHPTSQPPPAASLRTEQTLRDMWEASNRRRAEAARYHDEANGTLGAADAHDQAAAEARTAAAAEAQAAQSARTSARALFDLAEGRAAEAADLADIVNEKRTAAGLAPLTPGEPYPGPEAVPQPTAGDTLVASQQSPTETLVDGLPEQEVRP